jgi:predicted DCC family thiol-disulfide oxidoreductase YuxK
MSLVGVYDGDCGLCSAFVRFAISRNQASSGLTFRPYQSIPEPELARYGLDAHRCATAFQLIDGERAAHLAEGGPAIRAVLRFGGGLLGALAGAVDAIPPLLRLERIIYSAIAARRARISRLIGAPACTLQERRP